MTNIAPHMTAYLRQRLPVERAASQHEVARLSRTHNLK